MALRVLTWNMNFWQQRNDRDAAWAYLDDLDWDLALLQEAVVDRLIGPAERGHPHQAAGEVTGGAALRAGETELGHAGLDPALALHGEPTGVAGVDVGPQPLGLRRGQLAVDEGTDPVADMADHGADHRTASGVSVGFGPAYRIRPSAGARWASALRSMARPRWMRERTVPSLAPMISAISS